MARKRGDWLPDSSRSRRNEKSVNRRIEERNPPVIINIISYYRWSVGLGELVVAQESRSNPMMIFK